MKTPRTPRTDKKYRQIMYDISRGLGLYDAINEMCEHAEMLEAERQWVPIKDALKDGTCYILLCDGGEVSTGHWSTCTWVTNGAQQGAWVIYEARSDTVELDPTHFMEWQSTKTGDQA